MASRKLRVAGSVLTVKNLPQRAYQAIHTLPRGFRNACLLALLDAVADLAEQDEHWYKRAVANGLKVRTLT